MNLSKQCTCCGIQLTTRNVKKLARGAYDIGRDSLWLNCLKCNSTIVLPSKKKAVAV